MLPDRVSNPGPLTYDQVPYRLCYAARRRCWSSTYEGCDLVPLVTSSVGGFELVIHFQEAYARLFSNCYNKQGIQSNLPSYRPMNQETICAKVYPEGVQPTNGNNCGLIPVASSREQGRGIGSYQSNIFLRRQQ